MSEETGAATNKPTLKLKLSPQTQSVDKIRSQTIQPQKTTETYIPQHRSASEVRIDNAAEQANKLNGLLDGIAQSSNVIEDAKDRLTQVQNIVEQARELAKQSLASDNNSNSNIEQIKALLSEVNTVSQSGSFETNLLLGDTLETQLRNSKNAQTMETSGLEVTAQALGLDIEIETVTRQTYNQLSDAMQTLYSFSAGLNSASSQIKDQLSFTKETIETISQNQSLLSKAEQSDEAANLLALQTRQLLSNNANVPLASASQQNILRLF